MDIDDLRLFCRKYDIPLRHMATICVWLLDDPDLLYPKIVDAVLNAVLDVSVEHVEITGLTFRLGMGHPDVVVINYDVEGRETVLSVQKILPVRTKLVVLVSGTMSSTAQAVLEKNNSTILRY